MLDLPRDASEQARAQLLRCRASPPRRRPRRAPARCRAASPPRRPRPARLAAPQSARERERDSAPVAGHSRGVLTLAAIDRLDGRLIQGQVPPRCVSGSPTGTAASPGSQTVASTAGRPAKSLGGVPNGGPGNLRTVVADQDRCRGARHAPTSLQPGSFARAEMCWCPATRSSGGRLRATRRQQALRRLGSEDQPQRPLVGRARSARPRPRWLNRSLRSDTLTVRASTPAGPLARAIIVMWAR